MFQVGRYDPVEEKKKSAEGEKGSGKRKRKRSRRRKSRDDEADQDDNSPAKSTLKVIAPETSTALLHGAKLPPKTAEEAFDDLDLFDEAVEDEGATTAGKHVDASQASAEEIKAALHLSSLPIEKAGSGLKIAPFLVENLKRDGFENFFPIQSLVIPDVIASERHAHIRARDICITAPTGSGKTLSYVLPILNSLSGRQIQRLRALVVLPSRDLANQVHQVFSHYVEESDLKVGLAIGQSDFAAEKIALTVDPASDSPEAARHRLSFDPGNVDLALKAFGMGTEPKNHSLLRDGLSTVDILVCTPGRLVDHLENTPGFSLQHLRFLVVDEADRLLSQSYHNWIDRVIDATSSVSTAAWREIIDNDNRLPPLKKSSDGCSLLVEPITWRRGGINGDDSEFNNNDSYFAIASSYYRPVQLRKLLVSATLTRDPQKLAALRLVNPKHFDVHQLTASVDGSSNKYSMPEKLVEYTVECTAEQKPLVLLALVLERLGTKVDTEVNSKRLVVIFTQSVDSTHRLARLLQLMWASAGYGNPKTVIEFSSALNQNERSSLLQRCNDPQDDVSVVVCSDGMSRGMDLEFIATVVNYDVPSYAKTYVHRCGRTARAGKQGTAISVLKGGQVGQFAKMRQLIQGPDRVQPMLIQKQLVRDALPKYRQCVRALRDVLDAEENGELSHTEPLSLDYLPE